MRAPAVVHTFQGRFSCPVCSTRFAALGEKKRHIRETHPKEAR